MGDGVITPNSAVFCEKGGGGVEVSDNLSKQI